MSRYFCFTIWGGKPPEFTPFYSYLTYQLEAGERRGRKHYQGFVAFIDPQTLESALSVFKENKGLGYFQPAVSLQSAIRYSHKARSRVGNFVELGARPRADRTC